MGPDRSRWERALEAIVVGLPVALVVGAAAEAPDVAHDPGALRVLGLGYTGPFRGADALLSGLGMALPFGTESFRAALVGAVALGLLGGALFAFTRDLLRRVADADRLGPVVAAVASLTVTLSSAWQLEAGIVGGSAIVACLAVGAPAVLGIDPDRHDARLPAAALLAGLAAASDPAAGAAAILAVAALAARRAPPPRAVIARALGGFAVGLAPLGYAAVRSRASVFALGAATRHAPWGQDALGGPTSPIPLLHDQVGWLALALAVAGTVVALLAPASRRGAIALLALVTPALLAVARGAAAGPAVFAPAALVTVAAVVLLAGIGMQSAVLYVARADVPFARASAAMVVVLEITFPAVAADDAGIRAAARATALEAPWDDLLFAGLPSKSLVVLRSPALVRHFMALRARGADRGDVAILDLRDLGGRASLRELSRDADLAPLFRDMALRGAPGEFALASMASARNVTLEYDAAWEHALARHLLPEGAFDRFAPEPHGRTDRRRELEAFLPRRQEIARRITAPRDDAACALVATLLRARIVGLVAAGERELLVPAVDDLRAFSPDDPLANEVVRRVATSRGAIEVEGLPDVTTP